MRIAEGAAAFVHRALSGNEIGIFSHIPPPVLYKYTVYSLSADFKAAIVMQPTTAAEKSRVQEVDYTSTSRFNWDRFDPGRYAAASQAL